MQTVRVALSKLLSKLPAELEALDETKILREAADHKVYNIVHFIYRSKQYETQSKDYEFSRLTMKDHWRAGYQDATTAFQHEEIFNPPRGCDGVFVFDPLDNKMKSGRASAEK